MDEAAIGTRELKGGNGGSIDSGGELDHGRADLGDGERSRVGLGRREESQGELGPRVGSAIGELATETTD